MYFCFNVNCLYLYSHLCLHFVNVCVLKCLVKKILFMRTPCKKKTLYEIIKYILSYLKRQLFSFPSAPFRDHNHGTHPPKHYSFIPAYAILKHPTEPYWANYVYQGAASTDRAGTNQRNELSLLMMRGKFLSFTWISLYSHHSQ